MDSIDLKILRELVKDGRISNNRLSEKVGLSPSPCWQCQRRLEESGVIRGYQAIVDQEAMGAPETALIEVSLDRHGGYRLEQVCEQIAAFPEVLEVHITSGEFDCFVKVAVSSTRGYEEFLREKLYTIPHIRSSRSAFSLRCFKNELSYVP